MSSPSRFQEIVRSHLWSMRLPILGGVFCLLGHALTELLAPWPIKVIMDHVLLAKPAHGPLAWLLPADRFAALVAASLAILAIALLRGVFAYGQHFLMAGAGYTLVHRLRRELFQHLQQLSLSFHNRTRTGELLTKVTADTAALRDVFSDTSLTMAGHLVTVFGMFVVMFLVDWRLTLIVLATFPVLCYSIMVIYSRTKTSARRQREREGMMASRLNEVLGSVALVQAFARERLEQERFDADSGKALEESIRTARTEAASSRATEIISSFGVSGAVLFGGWQVLHGQMTPGDVLIFTGYLTTLSKPLRTIARLSSQISKAVVSAGRISSILETERGTPDRADAVDAPAFRGEIIFRDVCFGYGDDDVLKNLSFRIRAGERVAIVGGSGAGKSTLASLILRLYDPRSGEILIDGADVRDFRRESLRRQIGVVLQDTILFGASIRDNIAYGKPEATRAEVEAAARQTGADSFIQALPEGYDTVIAERGSTLSGGQRQRLCLARAILKDPSLLILDEPTAAVDAESAAFIHGALETARRGKTLLMIAHQFNGLEEFDRILVMKEGRLVEQGTHSSLFAERGYYYELSRLQRMYEARTSSPKEGAPCNQ